MGEARAKKLRQQPAKGMRPSVVRSIPAAAEPETPASTMQGAPSGEGSAQPATEQVEIPIPSRLLARLQEKDAAVSAAQRDWQTALDAALLALGVEGEYAVTGFRQDPPHLVIQRPKVAS
jgi:hypothetical protein